MQQIYQFIVGRKFAARVGGRRFSAGVFEVYTQTT